MNSTPLRFVSLAVLGSLGAIGLQLQADSRRTMADEAHRGAGVLTQSPEITATEQHPLDPALETARAGLAHIRNNLSDYTALLVKRERVKGKLGEHQFMEAKFRQRRVENQQIVQPFSVYLKFLKPQSVKGREVVWVENRDEGKLIAHEGGFKNLLRVKLSPNNTLAMLGQRYPITQIGIENLIVQLIEKGERDRKHDECEVRFVQKAKVDGRECTMIEVVHPAPRPHFDFYRARIFIDDELQVPIRYAAWTWPEDEGGVPVLEEEYTYTQLRVNVGLTDRDFDPDNPEYNFP